MTKILFLVVACLASTALINANPISQRVSSFISAKETKYRLPNDTVPINYKVHLTTRVDEENFDFTGEVEITLKVIEKTKKITLHQRRLEITSVALECNGNPIVDPKESYDDVTEFLTYEVVDELDVDTACVLTLGYKGELRTDNGGFYRSSYTDAKGKKK